MPNPAPTARPAGLTRRAALASTAAGLAVLAGACTAERPATGEPAPRRSPDVDPDVVLAGAARDVEQAMVDALLATTARHPDLTPALTSALDAHTQHVRMLARATPDQPAPASPSGSASPAPSESGSPTGAATPTPVPRGPRAALRRLAALEDRLSLDQKRNAFAARSGSFARVLAAMAASAAQHSAVLDSRPEGAA